MKISIIIPAYNVENYIEQCLDSIVSQSYSEYEIICVNDCSTDQTYHILLEYEEKWDCIKIVNNAKNSGAPSSRNRGLEAATGDYIMFVDADDMLTEGALGKIADMIEAKKPEVLFYDNDVIVEGEMIGNCYRGNRLEITDYVTGQFVCVNTWKQSSLNVIWGAIYQKSFLEQNGINFFEGIVTHEDTLFMVKVFLYAKKTISTKEKIYIYRKRANSITTHINKDKWIDAMTVVSNEMLTLWKTAVLEPGMEEFLEYTIQKSVEYIYNLLLYYPEKTELGIGNSADAFWYKILRQSSKAQPKRYICFNQEEKNTIQRFSKRIIFGTGLVAVELLDFLNNSGLEILGVGVSNTANSDEFFGSHKVKQIEEWMEYGEDALVIVAVLKKNQIPVAEKLSKLGFKHLLLIDTDRSGNSL